MKILIYSPLFYPSLGGVEIVTSILAHEFVNQEHEVKVVSQVPATNANLFPFEVIRKPNPLKVLSLIYWCDVYFHANISLKGIWPLLIRPKPWVIAHNGWYSRPNGTLGWQDYLKHFFLRFATGISVSKAVADHISTPSIVIPNPYCEDIFYEIPNTIRNRELVFLGRLVYQKGVDLLLEALHNLKLVGLTPQLTIIGTGLEELNLRQQSNELNINQQVNFVGKKFGNELTELLNNHKIMVVPSRYQEGFGLVALEGIACGCVVISSDSGGLKEAVGSCGATFPNGNVKALTQILFDLLTNLDQLSTYRENAEAHLSRHKKATVAKAYLQVMEKAIQ
ncbi:MAG TPA: glycosyltransferase family 4 protein [Coleofasciculaceae cyanobacterium]